MTREMTDFEMNKDEERAAGKVRSQLHGIPIVVKVNTSHDLNPWIYTN